MTSPSRHPRSLVTAPLLAGLLGGLIACNRPQVVQGACTPANGGDVCVWHQASGSKLLAFGATIPVRSIENAPADAPMVWPPVALAEVPLPDAVRSATGFDNLTVYWEAHGHPPAPFMTPHFDFHFNTATGADLQAIDCADSTRPATLPAGYEAPDVTIPQLGTLVGLCVPHMGMHALRSAELNSTALFQKSILVGYYHGYPIFLEPMIARATLLERRGFDLDVPDIPGRPAGTRYPTRFRADYDSTAQAYRFAFSAFAGAAAR